MRRQANYQLFHIFFVFIATNQSLSLQESIVLLYEILFVILANFLLPNKISIDYIQNILGLEKFLLQQVENGWIEEMILIQLLPLIVTSPYFINSNKLQQSNSRIVLSHLFWQGTALRKSIFFKQNIPTSDSTQVSICKLCKQQELAVAYRNAVVESIKKLSFRLGLEMNLFSY